MKKFYAVTSPPALWSVSTELNKHLWPTVTKIAESKSRPHEAGSVPVGDYLRGGHQVDIAPRGIALFDEDGHGNATSPLIALFVDEAKAQECYVICLIAESDPLLLDARWIEYTKEVLREISFGNPHPVFRVSTAFAELLGSD
jgi:hypothetical protein